MAFCSNSLRRVFSRLNWCISVFSCKCWGFVSFLLGIAKIYSEKGMAPKDL